MKIVVIGGTGRVGTAIGFDNKGTPPDATRAVVDTDTFRYYIAAQVTGAGANDTVALRGFQIMTIAQ